jgi:hypothetical protein
VLLDRGEAQEAAQIEGDEGRDERGQEREEEDLLGWHGLARGSPPLDSR